MKCPRCKGLLKEDDGDLLCLLCARRYYLAPVAKPLPNGAWWLPSLVRYGKCKRCGGTIRLHPNGLRTRCKVCQLDDLARRAREKRVILERRCLVCKEILDVGRKSQPEYHPGECYLVHRRVLGGIYRWEKKHGFETVPKTLLEGCPCPKR